MRAADDVSRESDAAVVRDAYGADDVVSLRIGCACCTVRDRLQAALRQLANQHEQGRHLSRVVIETREDAGPILRTFATDRALGAAFYLEQTPPIEGAIHFTLTEDTPLDWNAFSRFIATLVALRGADLLHVKGLLNVSGCRGPVMVQYVQHLAHRPVELQAWPDKERLSQLEFTARDVDESSVRGLFDAVRALT